MHRTPLAPLFSEQKRGDKLFSDIPPPFFQNYECKNREKGRGCPKGGGGFLCIMIDF
jgi:hypothetical protein